MDLQTGSPTTPPSTSAEPGTSGRRLPDPTLFKQSFEYSDFNLSFKIDADGRPIAEMPSRFLASPDNMNHDALVEWFRINQESVIFATKGDYTKEEMLKALLTSETEHLRRVYAYFREYCVKLMRGEMGENPSNIVDFRYEPTLQSLLMEEDTVTPDSSKRSNREKSAKKDKWRGCSVEELQSQMDQLPPSQLPQYLLIPWLKAVHESPESLAKFFDNGKLLVKESRNHYRERKEQRAKAAIPLPTTSTPRDDPLMLRSREIVVDHLLAAVRTNICMY